MLSTESISRAKRRRDELSRIPNALKAPRGIKDRFPDRRLDRRTTFTIHRSGATSHYFTTTRINVAHTVFRKMRLTGYLLKLSAPIGNIISVKIMGLPITNYTNEPTAIQENAFQIFTNGTDTNLFENDMSVLLFDDNLERTLPPQITVQVYREDGQPATEVTKIVLRLELID